MSEFLSVKQHLMLQSWMSAAFPIGAYSCSHGLETAIQDNRIDDRDSCQAWILAIAGHGSGWNDSVIMAHAHRLTRDRLHDNSSANDLCELNDLALALQAGSERHLETTRLAGAFLDAAASWGTFEQLPWQAMGDELSLPVVTGALGSAHNIPATILLASALQSMTSNLAWIATRLVPLGQTSCLQMIAALGPEIESIADRATSASLEELGSCTLLADLASLQHEQLTGRVCQT